MWFKMYISCIDGENDTKMKYNIFEYIIFSFGLFYFMRNILFALFFGSEGWERKKKEYFYSDTRFYYHIFFANLKNILLGFIFFFTYLYGDFKLMWLILFIMFFVGGILGAIFGFIKRNDENPVGWSEDKSEVKLSSMLSVATPLIITTIIFTFWCYVWRHLFL